MQSVIAALERGLSGSRSFAPTEERSRVWGARRVYLGVLASLAQSVGEVHPVFRVSRRERVMHSCVYSMCPVVQSTVEVYRIISLFVPSVSWNQSRVDSLFLAKLVK